jgi:hypothetical protein
MHSVWLSGALRAILLARFVDRLVVLVVVVVVVIGAVCLCSAGDPTQEDTGQLSTQVLQGVAARAASEHHRDSIKRF